MDYYQIGFIFLMSMYAIIGILDFICWCFGLNGTKVSGKVISVDVNKNQKAVDSLEVVDEVIADINLIRLSENKPGIRVKTINYNVIFTEEKE